MLAPDFRLLRREELDVLLEWAAREGWNPGLFDSDAFWAADPEGFWGMEVAGKLVGGASTVTYGGLLGFVGLFIVRPEFRSQGLGTQFWKFFIGQMDGRLQPGAASALDGVFARQAWYAKNGFVFTHRNLRMEGTGQEFPPADGLMLLADVPFEEIVRFDARHFGIRRPAFLRNWIQPAGGLGLAEVRDGRLAGCGVIRPCQTGFKMGPLFADDPDVADRLFRALSARAVGCPLFLDVPEINASAMALAARYGLKECFGCARMVRGKALPLPWSNIYGVTTFELG